MLRKEVMVLGLATLTAACSGGGPQTAGGSAPPTGIVTGASSTHSFVTPTETKTYQSQAAVQSYGYTYTERDQYKKVPLLDAGGNPILDSAGKPTLAVDPNSRTVLAAGQADQLYKGNTSSVRSPGVTVTYDPHDAQFTLQVSQDGLSDNLTFQDPAHRTDFGGAREPQPGVPDLNEGKPGADVRYLQAGSGNADGSSDVYTFFYEQPGTTTKYVTYAGFVRNTYGAPVETVVQDGATYQNTDRTRPTSLERAAFVFGEQTDTAAVPKTGTANYSGNMIASMVNNPLLDVNSAQPSNFQWISGTANVAVDFGKNTVNTSLAGTTLAPLFDASPISLPGDTSMPTTAIAPPPTVAIPAGAAFAATGSATIDMVKAGGFTGTFSDASFTNGGTKTNVTIAGSTIDGAFYGPKADEVGASFRIVGGVPDQRVDIIGSFTGAKPH